MTNSELIDYLLSSTDIKGQINVSQVEIIANLKEHCISKEFIEKIIKAVPHDFYFMDNKIVFIKN